jgi:hypothetical protein
MTGLDCNILVHIAGVSRLLTSDPADFVVFGVFEIITP